MSDVTAAAVAGRLARLAPGTAWTPADREASRVDRTTAEGAVVRGRVHRAGGGPAVPWHATVRLGVPGGPGGSGDPADGPRPRRFQLHRDVDVTGASGVGVVADGVAWPDGTVSVRWRGDRPSVVFWEEIGHAYAVHGHGGSTRFVWLDDEQGRELPPPDGGGDGT